MDVLLSIDQFAAEIGPENVLNLLPPLFTGESLELKKELLTWVLKNMSHMPRADSRSFVTPVLHCVVSKQREIRQLGEQALEGFAAFMGVAPFYSALNAFKPAVQQ
jgi:hypothetical protein